MAVHDRFGAISLVSTVLVQTRLGQFVRDVPRWGDVCQSAKPVTDEKTRMPAVHRHHIKSQVKPPRLYL